jgi:beta-lactam-binding protein with PASTA domain
MTAQARLLGGRYQVGELLGYGGMAEVHRGRDLRLGRDVAIKMLRSDLARDATFQMRFEREAQNAASLNHPAIVSVYDTGEERGPTGEVLPYIVMEFVNGRTLKEILGVEGRLMPRRALEITADICAALEFSHRHSIIHRDIKPGNVMLTQTGQVKVMDFGIARALASGASTMTQTSAVIGTAQYLSPEQARGEAVDARSDVYATGCLLFELLTGAPPFVGDNPVSVAYQHVREDARPPSQDNPDIPPDVDAVVLKALAKNPINRYQSAAEMRADLLRAATGRPVLATPVMQRDDATQMVYPAAATQVMGGPRPTGSMARVGDARRRRTSTWVLVALALIGILAVLAVGLGLYLTSKSRTVAVPDVVGKTETAARQQLQGAGLVPARQEESNATCKKGLVTKTDPAEGLKVDQNSTVNYFVCVGPAPVTVPAVVGQQYDAAKAALVAAGFKVAQPVFQDSDHNPGEVLKQDPDGNAKALPGATVTLTVARAAKTTVPNVMGQDLGTAQNILAGKGLNVRVKDSPDATADQVGTVVRQDPGAGTQVKPGSIVTIYVGRAQPTPSQTTQSPSPAPSSPSPTASASPTP